MREFLLKWYVKARIWEEENGQDLIEYALVVALLAMTATAGMRVVANKVNQAFSNVGSKLGQYIS